MQNNTPYLAKSPFCLSVCQPVRQPVSPSVLMTDFLVGRPRILRCMCTYVHAHTCTHARKKGGAAAAAKGRDRNRERACQLYVWFWFGCAVFRLEAWGKEEHELTEWEGNLTCSLPTTFAYLTYLRTAMQREIRNGSGTDGNKAAAE